MSREKDHFALKNFLSTKIGNKKYYHYEHPTDTSFRWEGEAWDKNHARSKALDAYEDHKAEKKIMKEDMYNQKDHYAAIEDVHVNLENRNHAFEEYGYGPLNPREPSNDFWKQKAKVFNTTPEEAKKSRCGNCAAFNQSKEVMKRIAAGLGPVGDVIAEKADLGFCEMFKFKCAAERTCDAWLVNGPITEGISDYLPSADSVYAFGRNVADTATFGGYKYARAGVDYAAKNVSAKLGYGKGTTYDKELKQEKEKLARDDVKNPKAAAAGDIAGYAALAVAPEIPAVGKTIGSVIGAGEKASKVPYYVGLARKAVGMEEEMNVSAIAGTGDPRLPPDQREPGRPPEFMPMLRRKTPRGKFAGYETFILPHSTYLSLKEAKRKHKHWKKYLEEDDSYYDIREYAMKKNGPIVVEDERTGACMFVRYGKQGLHEAWTNRATRSMGKIITRAGANISSRSTEKIGDYDKEHSIHTETDSFEFNRPIRHYHLVHNTTGHITHSVNGPVKNNILSVYNAGASEENKKIGTKVKMEDFYHHLLKRGARHEASGSKERNRFPVGLVGTNHSGPSEDEEGDYGAQRVWRNLAKKARMTVHGFKGGKKGTAVNLGKAEDPTETHADAHEYNNWSGQPARGADKERTEIGKMSLVAAYDATGERPKKSRTKKITVNRRGR